MLREAGHISHGRPDARFARVPAPPHVTVHAAAVARVRRVHQPQRRQQTRVKRLVPGSQNPKARLVLGLTKVQLSRTDCVSGGPKLNHFGSVVGRRPPLLLASAVCTRDSEHKIFVQRSCFGLHGCDEPGKASRSERRPSPACGPSCTQGQVMVRSWGAGRAPAMPMPLHQAALKVHVHKPAVHLDDAVLQTGGDAQLRLCAQHQRGPLQRRDPGAGAPASARRALCTSVASRMAFSAGVKQLWQTCNSGLWSAPRCLQCANFACHGTQQRKYPRQAGQ